LFRVMTVWPALSWTHQSPLRMRCQAWKARFPGLKGVPFKETLNKFLSTRQRWHT